MQIDAWSVHRIVSFPPNERFTGSYTEDGLTLIGLHALDGSRFLIGPKKNWIGCFRPGDDGPSWSVGPRTKKSGPGHIAADFADPSWIADCGDGSYLISDAGHNRICVLDLAHGTLSTHIELRQHGLRSPENCILDPRGNIWVNDPTQAALWVFTRSGALLRTLGTVDAPQEARARDDPPHREERPLEDMDLDAVYDMRCGSDGLIYILEGSRFRLRAVDFQRNRVTSVAGSGAGGYSGDGGDPRAAAFGSARTRRFDGPWAFCLDGKNAIYIADTQNRAVRMIDPERRRITTIAGGRMPLERVLNRPGETDPLDLALPSICWMDWGEGMLFVTDRNGDLTILSPSC